MTTRTASCSCGQLRVTAEGEPVRVSMCHCLECQKRTGSAFGAQSRFPRERVRIEGSATKWSRVGDDGGKATFSFCPTCGTTVYYEIDDQPELLAVTLGSFADPMFPPPRFSVYESRRHAWVSVPDGAERWD
jgi:hypothetical protein